MHEDVWVLQLKPSLAGAAAAGGKIRSVFFLWDFATNYVRLIIITLVKTV